MVADRPRVSVIVNCFNGERYLREALDSIAAQTMTDFEVIFWDNGSTDGSAGIAQQFGPALRYFRADRTTTLGEARNLAVQQSRGEFFAFLDTDDRWYPHTLQTLLDGVGEAYGACYAGVRNITAAGEPIHLLQPPARSGSLLDALLTQFDIYVPALIVRRSELDRTGLAFDPQITASEEYCLFVQLAAETTMRSIPDVVADYRVHAGALTGQSIDKWADERFYTLARLEERHPGVSAQHHAAWTAACARGRYYRARFLMATGRPAEARKELRQATEAGSVYWALYFLSFAPLTVWNAVHQWKTGRATA